MTFVLVVDNNCDVRETFSKALQVRGFQIANNASSDVVRLTTEPQPYFAVLRKPIRPATHHKVMVTLRHICPSITVVIAAPTLESESSLVQHRFASYVSDLIAIVDAARFSAGLPEPVPTSAILHATTRWSSLVLRVVDSPSDPTTLKAWARFTAVSVGTLRNWCRTAALPARRSLMFARMLRVVLRSEAQNARLEELLDVVDQRTIAKLLRLGDRSAEPIQLPITVEDFLARQKWISGTNAIRTIADGISATCGLTTWQSAAQNNGRTGSNIAQQVSREIK